MTRTHALLGHSSVEDAKAALDLVQLKLKSPSGFAEAEKLEESIFARLAAHKKASSMADTRGRCSKHTSTTADLKHCWEDSQSTAAAVAACKAGKHLVVARLGELGKGELPKDESDPRVQATAAHLEALLAEYAQPASLVSLLLFCLAPSCLDTLTMVSDHVVGVGAGVGVGVGVVDDVFFYSCLFRSGVLNLRTPLPAPYIRAGCVNCLCLYSALHM